MMPYIAAAPFPLFPGFAPAGCPVPDAVVTPAMIASGMVMTVNAYRARFEGYDFQQQVNKLAPTLSDTFRDPYRAAAMLLRTEWDANRRLQVEMARRAANPGAPLDMEPLVLAKVMSLRDNDPGVDFFHRYDRARYDLNTYV